MKNPDYDTEIQTHKGTFDNLLKTFREREVDIHNEEEEKEGSRLRQAKRAHPFWQRQN